MICHELQANATAHAAELVAAFRCERDDRVRRILLGVICDTRVPEAFPLLMEYLRSHDEGLRYWAIEGLPRLDTPETRKVLWQAGYHGRTKTEGCSYPQRAARDRHRPPGRPVYPESGPLSQESPPRNLSANSRQCTTEATSLFDHLVGAGANCGVTSSDWLASDGTRGDEE